MGGALYFKNSCGVLVGSGLLGLRLELVGLRIKVLYT